MPDFTSKTISVANLLVDDHFRMGGIMYRITKFEANSDDTVTFTASATTIDDEVIIKTPSSNVIKIYNQCYHAE